MQGPVAIGGIGGSGTRVVANILAEAGFYLGSHLNEQYDNLWFTLLCRRPHWELKASDKEIEKAIGIFDKAMNGSLKPSLGERLFIHKAEWEFITRHYIKSNERWSLPIAITKSLIHSRNTNLNNFKYWGWKEPNTHIFLKPLVNYYPNMKYIHVMRNGLDMAFSSNQLQLRNWGGKMGVKPPYNTASSLEYWIKANQRAIQTGEQLLKSNFLLINFETLCTNPAEEVKKLLSFIGAQVEQSVLDKLITLPKLPGSVGRYKKENLSMFSNEQLNAVKQSGYDINV